MSGTDLAYGSGRCEIKDTQPLWQYRLYQKCSCFELISPCPQCERAKPDPLPYQLAMEKLGYRNPPTTLRTCYAMPGTEIYPITLGTFYAMSSTDISPVLLITCYVKSGTDIPPGTLRLVRTDIVLCIRFAMPGTGIVSTPPHSGTDIGYHATKVRVRRYAMSGTDKRYAATRCACWRCSSVYPATLLRACYALSGTAIGCTTYAIARRCPVLTWLVVLPGALTVGILTSQPAEALTAQGSTCLYRETCADAPSCQTACLFVEVLVCGSDAGIAGGNIDVCGRDASLTEAILTFMGMLQGCKLLIHDYFDEQVPLSAYAPAVRCPVPTYHMVRY
eukprot:3345368-Rhodomonas_salina.5